MKMKKGYMNIVNCVFTIAALVVLVVFARAVNAEQAPPPPLFSGGDGEKRQYYVSPDGGDANDCGEKSKPCSLNTGLNRAQAGESVILTDGTYAQQLVTRRSGKADNHIVIRAEHNGKAKIEKSMGDPVLIKHDYITIRGLWVSDKRSSPKSFATIRIYRNGGNHHIIIEDCTIFQAGMVGFSVTGAKKKNNHIIFRNNFIDGSGYNKDFSTGEAIYIGKFDDAPGVENIMIYGNKIRDFTSNGIDVKVTATKVWIYNNEFYDQVPFAAHGVPDHFRDGTILIQGAEAYVFNNIIRDSDVQSQIIEARASANSKPNLIYNNVIYNCVNHKLAVSYKSGNGGVATQVFNNTFFNLDSHEVGTDNKLIVKNNIGLNGVPDNLSTSEFDKSYFQNSSVGNFTLTPLAVKALNKATNRPLSSTDFHDNQISGQNRDYGAFEHGSTTQKIPPPTALRMIKDDR
jgi:hypothetical protein